MTITAEFAEYLKSMKGKQIKITYADGDTFSPYVGSLWPVHVPAVEIAPGKWSDARDTIEVTLIGHGGICIETLFDAFIRANNKAA